MEGLLKEANELLKEDMPGEVLDAALIAAAQRVEHYEMAGYGTARSYAEKLGDMAAADLLQETLNEEGLADQKLTRLALRNINFEALTAST
jgi:ferritin-like metal-binding protein YciE